MPLNPVGGTSSPAATSGLVGKVPAQAEFLRWGDPAVVAPLSAWLQEADEACRRLGVTLGSAPVRFVLMPSPASGSAIGSLVPSRDRVGRTFPLAAFSTWPAADLAARLPQLLTAVEPFWGASEALLAAAPDLATEQLAERVKALPLPAPADWQRAAEHHTAQLASPCRRWLDELRAQQSFGAHFAFHLLLTAVKEWLSAPASRPVILVCPLAGEGAWPWLALIQALLRSPSQAEQPANPSAKLPAKPSGKLPATLQPPTFLWSPGAPPGATGGATADLPLTLGLAPASTLAYLHRPPSQATQWWPLRASKVAAAEAARSALSAGLDRTLSDDTLSFAQLFEALSEEMAAQ